MADLVQFNCTLCHIPVLKPRSALKGDLNSKPRFCGVRCANRHTNEQRRFVGSVPCIQCGNSVHRKPAQRGKSGRVFCNRSCAAKYNNTHRTTGTRRSKLEVWLEERLREVYPDLDIHCNRRDAINAELDFYFPSLRLAFELNGIFHYEPIYGPEKLTRMQTNDTRKFQACLERGIELCVLDISSMIHFKPKGAERYLNIIQEVVDQVLENRVDAGWVVGSTDPLRGRVREPEPVVPRPLPFKAAIALEQAMAWDAEIRLGGTTRYGISKRDGFCSSEITRKMYLLHLPEEIRTGLLNRDPLYGNLQTRAAWKLGRANKLK